MLRGYAAFVAVCFLCVRANSAVIVPTTLRIHKRRAACARVAHRLLGTIDFRSSDAAYFLQQRIPCRRSAGSSPRISRRALMDFLSERSVQIDDRKGSVIGWFVDPTPDLNEEFLPGFTPYHLRGRLGTPAGENYDLLTVLNHELAHVFGFTTSYSRFQSHVSDADFGLREYHGNGVSAVLTTASDGTHLNDASPSQRFDDDLPEPWRTCVSVKFGSCHFIGCVRLYRGFAWWKSCARTEYSSRLCYRACRSCSLPAKPQGALS